MSCSTPLNSVIGFSEMISREMFGPLGNQRYHEYAALIGESGQYLLSLINDILDVAKIEAGKYVLSREPLNLAQTLERTLSVMMPQFREKGVELHVISRPICRLSRLMRAPCARLSSICSRMR